MCTVLASRTSTRETPQQRGRAEPQSLCLDGGNSLTSRYPGSWRRLVGAPFTVADQRRSLTGFPSRAVQLQRCVAGVRYHVTPSGSSPLRSCAGAEARSGRDIRDPGLVGTRSLGLGSIRSPVVRPRRCCAIVDPGRPGVTPVTSSRGSVTGMAMGNRPEVKTAPAPIVALDVSLLAGHFATALARVPFRHPFSGDSSPLSNLGITVTREVIRAFMGYASSLRIPEFRSLELVLDDICKRIMPPIVRSLDVEGRAAEFGGVPGILYVPRHQDPVGVVLYLHGGGYIGTSPTMYAFFTARVCQETGCAVFVADYRLAPEFPYPAGAEDASAIYTELVRLGIPPERIFLAGDSGGGGLANTVLLETHRPDQSGSPGGPVALLARGRPPPRRGLGDGERRPRHPAVEHPDRGVPARLRRHEQRRLAAERRPERVSADLRHLGRRRDVPRPHPSLRRRVCARPGCPPTHRSSRGCSTCSRS